MEIGGYKLESVRRFEPSMGAAFVRKRDALLVARREAAGYELELFELRKFKSLGRASVEKLAFLRRAGDKAVLLVKQSDPADTSEDQYKQTLEVVSLKDFGVAASFVEEKPGNVAANPDGTRIAVAHDFDDLHVWDARTGELLSRYAAKGIDGVAYSHDGALLAAKEFRGALKIFDATKPSEKPLASVATGGGDGQIAFHPSRHVVAVAGKSAIKLVDADAAEVTASIKTTKRESQSPITRMAFSPDGKLLVTATLTQGVVGFWDVDGAEFLGHPLELKRSLSGVDFDARGEHLLISTYKEAELYSITKA